MSLRVRVFQIVVFVLEALGLCAVVGFGFMLGWGVGRGMPLPFIGSVFGVLSVVLILLRWSVQDRLDALVADELRLDWIGAR